MKASSESEPGQEGMRCGDLPPLPLRLLLGFLTHTPVSAIFPFMKHSFEAVIPRPISESSNSRYGFVAFEAGKKSCNCDLNMAACGSSGERKILKMSVAPGARRVNDNVNACKMSTIVKWSEAAVTHRQQKLRVEIRIEIMHPGHCVSAVYVIQAAFWTADLRSLTGMRHLPSGAPSQTTKSAFLPPSAFRTSGIVDGRVMSVCRMVILGNGA